MHCVDRWHFLLSKKAFDSGRSHILRVNVLFNMNYANVPTTVNLFIPGLPVTI